MPNPTRTIETDVCVVGAGLIGLAHALEARRRGLSVVVVERGPRASGASVRGSGHLFFSALAAGPALDAASQARECWLELARRAGIAAETGGTLIIARCREELAVLEAAAAEPARRARMRSAKRVARLAPIPLEGVTGAFHAKGDLRIAPRSTAAALARLLVRDGDARIEWNTHVHEIEPGLVHAGPLRIRADAIVVCPGADGRTLPSPLSPRTSGLTLNQSQMLRLAKPARRRYPQTLATGLTLLEHPGFSMQAGIDRLRERLELETPELIERAITPVVTQLSNGELIVGSTATYTDDSPSPYSRARLESLLLDQVRVLLGIEPAVRQRWTSVQLHREEGGEDFLVTRPMAGVRVVRALRSTAAAVCHAYAAEVLDELAAGPLEGDMYITVRDLRGVVPGGGGVRDHARAFGPGQRPRS